MDKYDVIFRCYWADYCWTIEENLTLEEAEQIVAKKKRRDTVHNNGCCQYHIQKRK